MLDPTPTTPRRTGLPTPSTVVSEIPFVPKGPGRTRDVTFEAPERDERRYLILRTNQIDAKDRAVVDVDIQSAARERQAGDEFRGTSRRAAKLTVTGAETEVFADLADLIASLPAHAAMKHHDPEIGIDAGSERVEEERRNVRVRAFLYAASREDDNDYHLIVGRNLSDTPMYMTMELSGLPPTSSSHHPRLRAARDAYEGFFGSELPGTSYDFYDPPIELDVEGSLFFDMSHATGPRPGPQDLRPNMPVVWEVHPISEIVLEP